MAEESGERYTLDPTQYNWSQLRDGVSFALRVEKGIRKLLSGGGVCLEKAGEDVDLVVSTACIAVSSSEDQEPLFSHAMPNISFASGGDEETSEFVCYVGKDERRGRQCFVFECGVSLASQVLSVIGQAFNTRLQEFQQQSSQSPTRGVSGGGSVEEEETDVELAREVWYHGAIGRGEAESLVKSNGDFLVRKKDREDQYVLTGMQNGTPRHLLLMDENKQVRTRDRKFQSISHLIGYHRDNNLPITSTESVIVLKTPVLRHHH